MKHLYFSFLVALLLSLGVDQVNAQDLDWAYAFADSVGDASEGSQVASDAYGNVYVMGTFRGTIDFDPGSSTTIKTSSIWEKLFIQKLDSNGAFVWVKTIGNDSSDFEAHLGGIEIGQSGMIYLTGRFRGIVDFDPGSGATTLTSDPYDDIFVLKLDQNGQFKWVRRFGNFQNIWANGFDIDEDENLYLSGLFSASFDADPGAAVHTLTIASQGSFLLKLDKNGNFVWAQNLGDLPGGNAESLRVDEGFNVYVTGQFGDSNDFDPSGAVDMLVVEGYNRNSFIAKYDSAGNYIWAKRFGTGPANVYPYTLDLDMQNRVVIGGAFNGTGDFNPSATVNDLTHVGPLYDGFVLSLDTSGAFQWVRHLPSTDKLEVSHLTIDSDGNIFAGGHFTAECDLDPGIGVRTFVTESVDGNGYLVKLNSSGDLLWAGSLRGKELNYVESICDDGHGYIYVTGTTRDSTDFDLSAASAYDGITGPVSHFIARYGQGSCDLALQFDSVSNVSCIDSGYAQVSGLYGASPYSYEWGTTPPVYNDSTTFASSGMYGVTVTDQSSCTISTSLIVSGPTSFTGFDLVGSLVHTPLRRGFSSHFYPAALNLGCAPFSGSGEMTMILPSTFSYTSATITPNTINGDTLVWQVNTLIYDSVIFEPTVYGTVDNSNQIGDTLCFDLIITPKAGDIDTLNNVRRFCREVIAAYDPNDKQVYPQGTCPEHYVALDQKLTYTIRFQNTGNAEAINVYLLDTLHPSLDASTINIIRNSHDPLVVEVLKNNVLRLSMDSIMLPDSSSNEPQSHGFVTFEISPYSSIAEGTVVTNSGAIYFDFNAPIITNEVFNTFVSDVPVCEVKSIDESSSNYGQLQLYPNPTSQMLNLFVPNQQITNVEVYNVAGNRVMSQENSEMLDVSSLESGFYLVRVETPETVLSNTFVKR